MMANRGCTPRRGLAMAIRRGSGRHVFGRSRPSATGRRMSTTPHRDTHFRDLPDPTGEEPFHLDLKDVVSPQVYRAIASKKKLTFHLNGDMGGINYGVPQELVAAGMEA